MNRTYFNNRKNILSGFIKMKNRFISILVVVILLFGFFPSLYSLNTNKNDNDIVNSYYYVKSLIFSKDMISKEQFLLSMLKSIKAELKKRRDENKKVSIPSNEEFLLISKDLQMIEFDMDDENVSKMTKELKKKELEEYNLKLLKARLIKTALVETGSDQDKIRMFNDDYKIGIREYTRGNFDYSFFLFNELLSVFNYSNIDDVLFLKAECLLQQNKITEAIRTYRRIADEFIDSDFLADAYNRIVYLYYVKGDYKKVVLNYDKMIKKVEKGLSGIDDKTIFLSGVSYYKLQNYNVANKILSAISEKSSYYNHALYIRANSLTILRKYSEAKEIYLTIKEKGVLLDRDSIQKEIYEGALLKLGYISFNTIDIGEIKAKSDSLSQEVLTPVIKEANEYFEQISKESQYYEDALMGKAWVWHNLGNYLQSNTAIDELLEHNSKTGFLYEAKALMGFNNDLLGLSSENNNENYEFVLKAHLKVDSTKSYAAERIGILNLLENLNDTKQLMYKKNSSLASFQKYYNVKQSLMGLLKKSELYLENIEKKDPNMAFITKNTYESQILKKVINDTRREMHRLDKIYTGLSKLQQSTIEKSNYRDMVKLKIAKDDVIEAIKKADILNIYAGSRLNKISRRKIDLQRWSDLSFLKYVLSNIGIEELDKIDNEIEILKGKVIDIDNAIGPLEDIEE